MFMKRKTRAGQVYAYRVLLIFKTSVTYTKNNFPQGNYVRCEETLVGHNSIF